MKLIVGLGNPGREYEHTRHNVGFDVAGVFARKQGVEINRIKCKAVVGEGRIGTERFAVALPQTFMNLSGESVSQLVAWYKPNHDEIMVVYDDIDLPFGKLRIRPLGSAGTHNGMRNILYQLGYDDFPRLRVGMGRPPEGWDLKDFVLAKFESAEARETAFDAYSYAADVLVAWVTDGFSAAQALVSKRK